MPTDDREIAWTIHSTDLFDRRAPARLEASGHGLVEGLIELWGRWLFEFVREGGQRGFIDFQLSTPHREINIDGDLVLADRIRHWVFGDVRTTMRGVMAEANPGILKALAEAHARCLAHDDNTDRYLGKRYSERVIASAVNATTSDELMNALASVT